MVTSPNSHPPSLVVDSSFLRTLTRFGAFVEVGKMIGRSALSVASETDGGQGATVQAMIAAGADVNEADPGPAGRSSLFAAAFGNRYRNVIALSSAGANLEHKCVQTGRSALHVAAGRKNVKAVKALLDCSANVNALDDIGQTPLHLATATISPGIKETVRCLLDAGADKTVRDVLFKQTALDNIWEQRASGRNADEKDGVTRLLEDGKWAAARAAWRRRALVLTSRRTLQEGVSASPIASDDLKRRKILSTGVKPARQGDGSDGGWKWVVEWVLRLSEDDEGENKVFRNIVGFL